MKKQVVSRTKLTCRCIADLHAKGNVQAVYMPRLGRHIPRQKVYHYRKADRARFWHWEDQSRDLIGEQEDNN